MMRHPRWAVLLAAAAIPFLVLAPAVHARAATAAAPVHAMVQVTIQNFAFSPKTLTVAPGTTIMWTNKDSAPHTVTSDSGSTLASGDLSQGKSYTHTFTKAGTYAYHCAIHPFMHGTVIVSSGSGSATGGSMNGSGMGSMGSMGPMTTLALLTGYYDNHPVLFLATDSSDKNDAMSHHINYSASLAKSLSNADQIYLVTNGKDAGRGPVFSSEPGESDYTPLWQEVQVTWKDPSKAVALGQDTQITDLAQKGLLTLTKTGIVLNCPIIAPLSGSGAMMGSGMSGMGALPPTRRLSIFTGYYDTHEVQYLATDTSSTDEATRDHINAAPSLAKSLSNADDIYIVTNGMDANRGPVFGSQPGEKDYTPLWQEVRVTWKDPSKAVALGQDNQITQLAKEGKLTLTQTGVVLNCPIIRVLGGRMGNSGS